MEAVVSVSNLNVMFWYSSEGTQEDYENILVTVTSNRAEIQSGYLPNTSYRYTEVLGNCSCTFNMKKNSHGSDFAYMCPFVRSF
jgi:hypothetical protein